MGGPGLDEMLLGEELRTQIGRITLTYDELRQEILNRIGANNAFAAALNATNGELANALTLIAHEEQQRVDGQSALVSQMDLLAAVNNNHAAALIEETNLRLAADSATATQISALYAASNDNAAAIINEKNVRTSADSALAGQINTVQSTLGNQIATVQTNAQTQIDATNGKVNAMWTVKVQAGSNPPRISGIALANNGTESEFRINASRFVFDSGAGSTPVVPFQVAGGITYIENAVIRNLQTGNIAANAVTMADADTKNGYLAGVYLQPSVSCKVLLTITLVAGNRGSGETAQDGWVCRPKGRVVIKNGGTGAIIGSTPWIKGSGGVINATYVYNASVLFTYFETDFDGSEGSTGTPFPLASSTISAVALMR